MYYILGLPTNFKLKRFVEILTSEEKEEYMKTRSVRKASMTSQLQCSRHPERQLEYYCEPCKLLICGQCMISEHRPHGEINYAVDVLPMHIKHLQKHLPVANSVMTQGLTVIEDLRSGEAKLKKSEDERVATVENYFAEIHRTLEERERQILESFRGEVKQKVKLLAKRRQTLQGSVECVRKGMLSIEDIAESRADDIKVLIDEDSIKERLHTQMKAVESEIKLSEKSFTPLQLGFKPDPAIKMLCKSVGDDLQNGGPPLVRADTSPSIGSEPNLPGPFKLRPHSTSNPIPTENILTTQKSRSLDSGDSPTSSPLLLHRRLNTISEGEVQFPVLEIGAKGMVGANKQITPCPFGVTLANDNNAFLVADSVNHTISILTTSGKFLDRISSEGKGDGQLLEPTAVTTDPSGNIFVVEKGNLRIQKFSSAGKLSVSPPPPWMHCGICTSIQGLR